MPATCQGWQLSWHAAWQAASRCGWPPAMATAVCPRWIYSRIDTRSMIVMPGPIQRPSPRNRRSPHMLTTCRTSRRAPLAGPRPLVHGPNPDADYTQLTLAARA